MSGIHLFRGGYIDHFLLQPLQQQGTSIARREREQLSCRFRSRSRTVASAKLQLPPAAICIARRQQYKNQDDRSWHCPVHAHRASVAKGKLGAFAKATSAASASVLGFWAVPPAQALHMGL